MVRRLMLGRALVTNQFGAWYGQSSLAVLVVITAVTLWAFWTSIGRPAIGFHAVVVFDHQDHFVLAHYHYSLRWVSDCSTPLRSLDDPIDHHAGFDTRQRGDRDKR